MNEQSQNVIYSPIWVFYINSVDTLCRLHCVSDLGSAGQMAHHRLIDSSTKEQLNCSVLQLEEEWAEWGVAQNGAQKQHSTTEEQEVLLLCLLSPTVAQGVQNRPYQPVSPELFILSATPHFDSSAPLLTELDWYDDRFLKKGHKTVCRLLSV